MKVIYEPTGSAREFAPPGARLYFGACAHGCLYCYGPRTIRRTREAFVNHARLRQDVLRSDPYQPLEMQLGTTRQAIKILIDNGLRVMILTKGGMRAARNFDLLETYDRCRFETTVVFTNQANASHWEPNAPPVVDRIQGIHQAHGRRIKTWVSLQPVIDPDEALELIQELHPLVGHWKVGMLNYRKLPRPVPTQ
jgi:DNA repair photolyase